MTLHGPAGRVVAGCLAALLAVALSACGSSGGSSSGPAQGRCGTFRAAAGDLTTQVRAWRAGVASRNEVLGSARKLGSAVSAQTDSASGETGKALDRLGKAISNLVTTATEPDATKHQTSKAEAKVLHAAKKFGALCGQ
jgi:hypothetical protein